MTTELQVMDGEPDRTTYLGGSDVAAIVGLGAYGKTPLSVYLRKIGEDADPVDPDHQRFLERRKRFEPLIVQMLREEFDAEVVSVNRRYVHRGHDFMAAEIDFEWRDTADLSLQNGEIKTVSPWAFGEKHGWGEAGTDDVPIHYAAQAMYGLGVTGRHACVLAALAGLDTMVFYRIERDEETIAELTQRCEQFWTKNVLKRVPPAPVNMADCQRLAMRVRGRPVEADDVLLEHVRALRGIREAKRALEDDEEEVKFKIAESIIAQWGLKGGGPILPKDNALIMRDGAEIASWKVQKGVRLDVKKLKVALPEIYKAYSKASASRVMRINAV